MSKRLANLVIAGVPRCGTTSLFTYLNLHPEICGSKVKETQYFLPLALGENLPGIERYAAHFDHCTDQKYLMEASAEYFAGRDKIANAILDQLGRIRIILVFREPVERFVSYYKYMVAQLHIKKKMGIKAYFEACNCIPPGEDHLPEIGVYGALGGGLYSETLPYWIDTFGDSLKVVFFEHLRDNREKTLTDLADWLEINPSGFPFNQMYIENKSVGYKNRFLQAFALELNRIGEPFWRTNPVIKRTLRSIYYRLNGKQFENKVPQELITRLEDFYAPYNRKLAEMLQSLGYQDYPSWLSDAIVDKSVVTGGEGS